jgi:hypothetical protein
MPRTSNLLVDSKRINVNSCGLNDRGFESRQGLGLFLYTTVSRPSLGPTQPPIQWVAGAFSLGVKRPGRKADHSPPCSAEVKNAWSYTSTLQYAFTTWCLVEAQGQLYLYLAVHWWLLSFQCYRHSLYSPDVCADKGRFVALLYQVPCNEDVMRGGGIAPRIFTLGSRRRLVVSFIPRPLYSRGKSSRYPLHRRLGGP